VKAVFESGNEKLMSQKLDILIKAKEKEIEEITNAKEKYTVKLRAKEREREREREKERERERGEIDNFILCEIIGIYFCC